MSCGKPKWKIDAEKSGIPTHIGADVPIANVSTPAAICANLHSDSPFSLAVRIGPRYCSSAIPNASISIVP
eukprot:2513602-Rhodomonas_salina.2